MKVVIEYVVYNLERREIINAIEEVKRRHEHKYGYISWYKVTEKGNIELFDKLKNNKKTFWVEGKRVSYCARKREIASKGRFEMIKVNKLFLTIVGEIQKSVIDTYLKLQIPMLWRHFFKNIANNRDYVYKFCNRPPNKFDRHCREWYFYNNTDGSDVEDIRMLVDELNNYALSF